MGEGQGDRKMIQGQEDRKLVHLGRLREFETASDDRVKALSLRALRK